MHDRGNDIALRLLALGRGLFFVAMGVNMLAWLTSPELLAQR